MNYIDEKAAFFYSDRFQFRVTLPNLNYGMDTIASSDDFQSLDSKASKPAKNAFKNQIIAKSWQNL